MEEQELDAAQAAGHTDNGRIGFEGLPNTRDLGGLPAADGRRIACRRLLRSGQLASATPADLARLGGEYGLRLVVDLRTDEECAEKPDPMGELPGARLVRLPVFHGPASGVSRSMQDMERVARQMMQGEVEPAQLFVTLYPHLVLDDDGIAAYSAFFREILDEREGSVLWHCSAGKDRCGMASMLLEAALGVPEPVIEADYLATNRFYGIDPSAEGADPMDVLNGVDLRFLHAATAAIEGAYGGIGAYLSEALGVDGDAVAELRARYLV